MLFFSNIIFLDEIWDLIESVSEGFLTYSLMKIYIYFAIVGCRRVLRLIVCFVLMVLSVISSMIMVIFQK